MWSFTTISARDSNELKSFEVIQFCEQRKESHQHRGTILSGAGQNRVAAKEGYFPRGEEKGGFWDLQK